MLFLRSGADWIKIWIAVLVGLLLSVSIGVLVGALLRRPDLGIAVSFGIPAFGGLLVALLAWRYH